MCVNLASSAPAYIIVNYLVKFTLYFNALMHQCHMGPIIFQQLEIMTVMHYGLCMNQLRDQY